MVDIHTHILHHFDDGPETVEESIALLKELERSGVRKVVSTSHYYCDVMPCTEFVQRQRKKIERMRALVEKHGINIEIFAGAEVRIDPLILNLESLKELCIEGTDKILLEIPHDAASFGEIYHLLESIVSYYNVKPVLSYVERYWFLAGKMKNLKMLKEAGYIFQVDSGCFVDNFICRCIGFKLLKAGLVDVVASDCHDLDRRGPTLVNAYNLIEKKFGKEIVESLKAGAEQILK